MICLVLEISSINEYEFKYVSFQFGGKLISFDGNEKTVYVSQVVTEPELMYGFKELLAALEQNNIFDHCYKKAEQANDPHAKDVWNMIATQFYGEAFRNQACSLLGTTDLSLNEKVNFLETKRRQYFLTLPIHIFKIVF